MNKFKRCLYINFPLHDWSMQEDRGMNRHVHYYIRHFRVLFRVNLMMQLKCHIVSRGPLGGVCSSAAFPQTLFVVFVSGALQEWKKNYSMNLSFGPSTTWKRFRRRLCRHEEGFRLCRDANCRVTDGSWWIWLNRFVFTGSSSPWDRFTVSSSGLKIVCLGRQTEDPDARRPSDYVSLI